MRNSLLLLSLLFHLPLWVVSQGSIGSFSPDETVFYAQTKQMNQFFLRFNGEEDLQGKRLYPGDAGYHEIKARKGYINMLFDQTNTGISDDAKFVFIEQALNKKNPVFLDFHGNLWFAEVSATFQYKKEKVTLILYLKLEKQNGGYKWMFSNVYFDRFASWFTHVNDTANLKYFIHPMSHELDFMNLHKIFREPGNIDYYLESEYQPDMLALFVMETKNNNLTFVSVDQVKFHFFQVPGWYFEVSYFNRNSMNSGWLISNILRVNEKEKKELMENYSRSN
ncbi:MAG TPA: hypothetical protein PKN12_04420 [Bacteroidales bacterium]|nr:hypothetical protein [Bacteroidales bacterium]HPT10549.1 hypothetical protein [Bacteroidales bacterium]